MILGRPFFFSCVDRNLTGIPNPSTRQHLSLTMVAQPNGQGAPTTRWNDLPEAVLVCIMEELNSYEDLGSFIRVSRTTWDTYWSRRMSILLTLVPRLVGETCMREALGILRVPKFDHQEAEAWNERFAAQLADYQSDSYAPMTRDEVLPLQRLDARINTLLAYYHPRLAMRYDQNDYHSSESWRYCIQCANNPGLKFTLMLYELFPPSISDGPGYSPALLARHIGRKIKVFPLWQLRLGTDAERRQGIRHELVEGWTRRPY